MPSLSPENYDVLVFDCYGTLVDWQTAIASYWQEVLAEHDAHVTDDFLLSFHAEWEPVEQATGGLYSDVLQRVMQRLGDRLAFTPSTDELEGFVKSLANSRPFEDSIAAISDLSEQFELAIVSNTDRSILDITLKPFNVEFDYLVTAEETKAYKPSVEMFQQAKSVIGDHKRTLHVAQSLYHDIQPANKLGSDTVWINRQNFGDSDHWTSDVKPTWTFETLGEFREQIL